VEAIHVTGFRVLMILLTRKMYSGKPLKLVEFVVQGLWVVVPRENPIVKTGNHLQVLHHNRMEFDLLCAISLVA